MTMPPPPMKPAGFEKRIRKLAAKLLIIDAKGNGTRDAGYYLQLAKEIYQNKI